MPALNLRDVFRHGLGDVYDAEQQFLLILDQIETETERPGLRDRIRRHREETRQRIHNLERSFELLGSEPPLVSCAAIRGIREEWRNFKDTEEPTPSALEMYNLDAVHRAKGYQIASYRILCARARALGNDDVRRLLEQNLGQEEEMAKWLMDEQLKVMTEVYQTR